MATKKPAPKKVSLGTSSSLSVAPKTTSTITKPAALPTAAPKSVGSTPSSLSIYGTGPKGLEGAINTVAPPSKNPVIRGGSSGGGLNAGITSLSAPSSSSLATPFGSSVTSRNLDSSASIPLPSQSFVSAGGSLTSTLPGVTPAVNGDGYNAQYDQTTNFPKAQEQTEQPDALEQNFDKYIKSLSEPPSLSKMYEREERRSGIQELRQNVNNYQSQLNAIQAQAQADILSVSGQGRGIPEPIILGQKAQIEKEAAIRALPVAAQLAAAQGNLELAQQHLQTRFDLLSKDAEVQYQHRMKVIDAVYNFADKQEQRKLEERKLQAQREYDLKSYVFKADYEQSLKQLDPKYKLEVEKLKQELEQNAQSLTVTNPTAGPYGSALNVILGSNRLTKDQKASLIAAINTGDDPFTVIRNQAKQIMGASNASTISNYETARDALAEIGKQLGQFYAEGGDTNLLKGNFEKVTNRLGEVNDPRLSILATQIQGNLQIYRNAISGTAYSEQEGRDIATIFPGINKSQTLNQAILTGRAVLFDTVIDASYRSVLGPVYDEARATNAAGLKVGMSDRDFVETALNQAGLSYQDALNQAAPGEIPVIDNRTGQVGAVPSWEFDNNIYTPL